MHSVHFHRMYRLQSQRPLVLSMSERCAAALFVGKASARVGAGHVARWLLRASFLALLISDAALQVDGRMAD